MSSMMLRAAATYRATHVGSRSPLELVVMLYDGLVRYLTEARDGLAHGDLRAKRAALSRALALVGELQSTLDRENGGQVAVQLDGLYAYISTRLLEANMKGQVEGVDEALRLVVPLRDAWSQIAVDTHSVRVTA